MILLTMSSSVPHGICWDASKVQHAPVTVLHLGHCCDVEPNLDIWLRPSPMSKRFFRLAINRVDFQEENPGSQIQKAYVTWGSTLDIMLAQKTVMVP